MRIGQALGLRHADFVSHRRELRIVPRRDNANGARAKTFEEHTIPISAGLVRLYTGYMFDEYGQCDSDYVFVNLFAEPYGRPLRYQAVHQPAKARGQRAVSTAATDQHSSRTLITWQRNARRDPFQLADTCSSAATTTGRFSGNATTPIAVRA
jgi:hypothetical protein